MKTARLRAGALLGIGAALALVIGSCGGGVEPTVAPKATATATVASQPTPTARATATVAATVARPTQTAATPTATPAARPTTAPQATATVAPTPTAQSGVPSFPEAKYGGTLRRRLQNPPPSWDMIRERTVDAYDILQTVHDQVVAMNPNKPGEIVPQLATSWDITNKGLLYTFKMRPGVKFQSGDPLTAHDVKYTLELVMNPPKGVTATYSDMLKPIKAISVPDDLTVVIELKQPDASFLSGMGFGRMGIYSKKYVEAQGGLERMTKWPPMGSGPFIAKPDGYVRGVSAEVIKNDNYFVKGRPFLDGQKFFYIPDTGTAFAALLTGQINFGLGLNMSQANEARQRLGDKIYIQRTPTLDMQLIYLNTTKKPFDDIRVREAISLAVDRWTIMQLVDLGMGTISGALPSGSGWELSEKELQEISGYVNDRKANLVKAKDLLAQAGYPNGLNVPIVTREHQSYIDLNTAIKANLADAGITGKLNLMDSTRYFAIQMLPTEWEAIGATSRSNDPDPNLIWRLYFTPGAPKNYPVLQDPKMMELFNAQAGESDPAKRRAAVKEMEKYTLKLYSHVIFYHKIIEYGWFANIKNHQFHASYNNNNQFRDVWMQ